MLNDILPLFEQIVGTGYDKRIGPIHPIAAHYAEFILHRGQDFLETSITNDRHFQWPKLKKQVNTIETEAKKYYSERISEHVIGHENSFTPTVQAAILRCGQLASETSIDEYSCVPNFLYACRNLIESLKESASQFVCLGANDVISRSASDALWYIKQDWNLNRTESIISPSYSNLERMYTQYSVSPFCCWMRLEHLADKIAGRTSDASWCTPFMLPPTDFPNLNSIPLSDHKANNGRFFIQKYFDEEAVIVSTQIIHERLISYLDAQSNEDGPVEMRHGPFTAYNRGEYIKLYGNELHIPNRYKKFLTQLILAKGSQVDISAMREAYDGKLEWRNAVKYASDIRMILTDKLQRNVIKTDTKEGWRLDIGV